MKPKASYLTHGHWPGLNVVRVIFLKGRSNSITPWLLYITFQWLPTDLRIAFKSFNLVPSQPHLQQMPLSSLSMHHTHCNSHMPHTLMFLLGLCMGCSFSWEHSSSNSGSGYFFHTLYIDIHVCTWLSSLKAPDVPILT